MQLIDVLSAWASGPAFSPALAVRIGLALAALPLLYRHLRDDPSPDVETPDVETPAATPHPAHSPRALFFALLGTAALFSLSSRWAPEPRSADMGKGFQAFSGAVFTYRFSLSPVAEMVLPPDGKPDHGTLAVEQLAEAVKLLPESVYLRRYYGVVQAQRGDYEAARKSLEQAMETLARRAPQRAADERQLWQAFFGEQKPTRAALDALEPRLEALGLGWIAQVGALAAYERIGEEAPELRKQVRQGAADYVRRGITAMSLLLLLIPQLALIALVVGSTLITEKVLRPQVRIHHPTGPILLEGFILMLGLSLMPAWVELPGRTPAPETQPGAFALRLVMSDVMQLFALGYLWLRLRAKGLTLEEIGLSRRGLGTNVAIGVGAAMIVIPAAAMVGVLTQMVGLQFFPNVPAPHHPLGLMVGTTNDLAIRGALFFGAAVGAPIFEEIFFRGALFGALRRKRSFWTSLLASSAFFALLHPQLPLGFLTIAVLGGAFAGLYEWRQSLVPGMIVHALNNGLAFFSLSLMFPTSN